MGNWLGGLLKKHPNAAAAGDEEASPRIRDADGRQLAQLRTAMRDELELLAETVAPAHADLGLESTEELRATRARTRKKKR